MHHLGVAGQRRGADPGGLLAHPLQFVLRAVDDGAYANLEMPKVLTRHDLSGRDAAFATELALGTIRRQGFYDRVIETGSGRAPSQIDPVVLAVLRLGVHQILSMRVPVHAATSETVALAREHAGSGAAGFVNAVLRRAGERDRETWIADLTRSVDDADEVRAVATSHPRWVVSALRQSLRGHRAAGGDGQASLDDALDALLEADNTPPRVSLVARPGLATVDELVASGAEASDLSPVDAIARRSSRVATHRSATSAMSSGRAIAAVLTDTLSAPASSSFRMSPTDSGIHCGTPIFRLITACAPFRRRCRSPPRT